jgi:hypothetical protein
MKDASSSTKEGVCGGVWIVVKREFSCGGVKVAVEREVSLEEVSRLQWLACSERGRVRVGRVEPVR